MRFVLASIVFISLHGVVLGQWATTGGPAGGDIVSLTADSQYLYAGTVQGHVWRRPLPEILSAVRDGIQIRLKTPEAALSSYPNPCNASTMLSILLPEASQATVRVYDVLGREVLVVSDRLLGVGSHLFPVDTRNLASGVYVVLLRAGDIRMTHRILLIR